MISGPALHRARKRQSMTLRELAEALAERVRADAPSVSTLQRWEKGRGAPSGLMVPHLAKALGVRVEELAK